MRPAGSDEPLSICSHNPKVDGSNPSSAGNELILGLTIHKANTIRGSQGPLQLFLHSNSRACAETENNGQRSFKPRIPVLEDPVSL